jgi:dihydroorotase
MLIAVHCEDETTVQNNLKKYKAEYGEDVPVTVHHLIRSEELVISPLQKRLH